VISTRHSRSTIITTNTAFFDWGNVLYNTTIATAIADRLVENSEIFLLGGNKLLRFALLSRGCPKQPRRSIRHTAILLGGLSLHGSWGQSNHVQCK
jgi:hypothetical protein